MKDVLTVLQGRCCQHEVGVAALALAAGITGVAKDEAVRDIKQYTSNI